MRHRVFAFALAISVALFLVSVSLSCGGSSEVETPASRARGLPTETDEAPPTPPPPALAAPAGATHPAMAAESYSFADLKAHARTRAREFGDSFTILVEEPFVVFGDDTPERVERYAQSTVRWSVDLLRKGYFSRDPVEIVEVWLFKNRESYRKHTLEIFGDSPTTPYGYYSSVHRALIMNIATGGGTLVHEIVHPFIEANFPCLLYTSPSPRDPE